MRPVRALVVDQPVPVVADELRGVAEAEDGDGGRVRVGDPSVRGADVDRMAERGEDSVPLSQDSLGFPPLANVPEGDHRPTAVGAVEGSRPAFDRDDGPVTPGEPILTPVDGLTG